MRTRVTLLTFPFALLLLCAFCRADEAPAKESDMLVYIGTTPNAKNDSRGIYVMRFDAQTGKLSEPTLAVEAPRPSFLALHPTQPFLYSCSELADAAGKKSGAVAAYRFDRATGQLTLLNHQPSAGTGPCHLAVDRTGSTLAVANYTSGSIASYAIDPATGQLSAPVSTIQHKGSGPNPKRQEGPHAHSINFDPTNQFALAADLGTDEVLVYRFDPKTSSLTPNDPPSAKLKPGAGPRHLVFSRDGNFVFVVNELDNTVTAFRWNARGGSLEQIQNLSTLPEGYTEVNHCAEINTSPSGRHVYASNRGHDSLAVFSLDPSTGQLTAQGQTPTAGKTPRFALDPTGNYLFVANQGSNAVVLFKVDPTTGALTKTPTEKPIGGPTCVVFVK